MMAAERGQLEVSGVGELFYLLVQPAALVVFAIPENQISIF